MPQTRRHARRSAGHPGYELPATGVKVVADDDLPQLIARLAEAESSLERARGGQVDTVVHGEGYSYLLHEAQLALVHSEARLKDDAALLEAVLRSAPDLVTYVGADGIVRWVNVTPPGTSILTVIGTHWLSFELPDQREALVRVFGRALRTGEPASFDGPGSIDGGAVGWRSRRFGPVRRDGQVIGIVIVSRDVTDAKAAEVQLMISDRMASLGALAAGMAHEINNPLSAAMGNVEVVRESLRGSGRTSLPTLELVDILDDVLEATGRIRFVVRDLKMFSRSSDDTDTVAVDVQKAIDSALRMARNETRHRARVVVQYAHTQSVVANESRLGQVFLNLLVNAAQALPEGDADSNTIRIATYDGEDSVTVKISDTGPGIPPEVQKHLFTPFFTTKPVGIGTGLGLSICRRIVSSFGGEISFRSVPDQGTDFFVSLPVADDSGPIEAAVGPSPGAVRRGKILVIDDDKMVGDSTSNMLSGEHEVVTVTGGADALVLIHQSPKFDVILCDLMMPQMTGMDFFMALSTLDPGLLDSVVFVTGGAFTPSASAFLKAVRNRHLEKPFDLVTLRGVVNKMVR